MKRVIIILNAVMVLGLVSCGGSRHHAKDDRKGYYDKHTNSRPYNQEQHDNPERHNY